MLEMCLSHLEITYQMTRKDDFSTIADQVLDGWDGGSDSCIICDILTVVQWHIQISPNEHLLAL